MFRISIQFNLIEQLNNKKIEPIIIEGRLPILPCLYNAIMVENPSHMARVYLVSWYRDLLTIRTNLLSNISS